MVDREEEQSREPVTHEGDCGSDSFSREVLARLGRRKGSFGRYSIKGEVARGGMGVILRVWDEDLRRNLAMKLLLAKAQPEKPGQTQEVDPRSLGRFLEEAHVAGQLDHPGILPVHELGLDPDGQVYFTMKLVKGRTLRDVFDLVAGAEEGWTHARALGVILKVCEAMSYAHDKGVVHRDLKPSNVMVGRFGEVYVMDWGVARISGRQDRRNIRIREPDLSASTQRMERLDPTLGPDSPLYTMDGDVVGTPAYMPPEQAEGRTEEIGPRSDVYAVGAMLYHLISGQIPYVSNIAVANNYAIWRWVQEGPPPPLAELAPRAPAELVAICEKAMERDPEARYAGMLELASDLRAFLENHVVVAYETGAVAEFRKWVIRNRGMAAALAGLVLLAIGASVTVAGLQISKQRQVSQAYDRLEQEKDEKQRLSDIMTARVLLDEFMELTPDYSGIQRMRQWLSRLEDIRSRKQLYERELAEGLMESGAVTAQELESFLGHLARLEEREHAVRRDLEAALALYQRSIDEVRDLWRTCAEGIKGDSVYGGLRLSPQLGLVPLRRDLQSDLWEFWHVLSGERPRLDAATDRWLLEPDTGLVLVLVPGGEFAMGSADDSEGHQRDEALHTASVATLFVSKFETTQAQWSRVAGSNPSYYPAGFEKGGVPTTELNPVESVRCGEADALARRLGLRLPAEEEWEYVCRAGSGERFSWGNYIVDLRGKGNFGDQSFVAYVGLNVEEMTDPAPWDDGFPITAPVGSFEPNAFGLYDVHGNVGEWTSSTYAEYAVAEGTDTETVLQPVARRTARGGNHYFGPRFARSASRQPLRHGMRAIGASHVALEQKSSLSLAGARRDVVLACFDGR